MVYEDAEKLYAEVRQDGEVLLEEAFDVLFPFSVALSLSTPSKKLRGTGDIIAFNTTFFPRRDVVQLPLVGSLKSKFSAMSTRENIVQASQDGQVGYVLMDCAQGGSVGAPFTMSGGLSADYLPASGSLFSLSTLQLSSNESGIAVYTNGLDHFVLKNSSVQLTISKGRICSLVDVKLGWVVLISL